MSAPALPKIPSYKKNNKICNDNIKIESMAVETLAIFQMKNFQWYTIILWLLPEPQIWTSKLLYYVPLKIIKSGNNGDLSKQNLKPLRNYDITTWENWT